MALVVGLGCVQIPSLVLGIRYLDSLERGTRDFSVEAIDNG